MTELLSLASKVLLDQELLKTRKENEELRARNEWLEHGPDEFNRRLAQGNFTGTEVVCNCPGCFLSKRYDLVEPELVPKFFLSSRTRPRPQCVLLKCLLDKLSQVGLSWAIRAEWTDGEEIELDPQNDVDAHIVIVRKDDRYLWEVDYGKRLQFSDKFHLNPAVCKVQELWEMLEESPEEFFTHSDGTNYLNLAELRDDPLSENDLEPYGDD